VRYVKYFSKKLTISGHHTRGPSSPSWRASLQHFPPLEAQEGCPFGATDPLEAELCSNLKAYTPQVRAKPAGMNLI
jgi:hypothetical protein